MKLKAFIVINLIVRIFKKFIKKCWRLKRKINKLVKLNFLIKSLNLVKILILFSLNWLIKMNHKISLIFEYIYGFIIELYFI